MILEIVFFVPKVSVNSREFIRLQFFTLYRSVNKNAAKFHPDSKESVLSSNQLVFRS